MILLWLLACHGSTGEWTREAALAPALARLDADGDGKVTSAEYTKVAFQAPPFADVDRDGDGALELDELDSLVTHQDPRRFWDPTPRHPPGRGRRRVGGPGEGGPVAGAFTPGPNDPVSPMSGKGPPPMGEKGPPPMGEKGPPPGGPIAEADLPIPPSANAGPVGLPTPGTASPSHPTAGSPPPGAEPPAPIGPIQQHKRKPRGPAWAELTALREEVLARDPAADVPTPEDIAVVDATGGLSTPGGRAVCGRLEAAFGKVGLPFPPSLSQGATGG